MLRPRLRWVWKCGSSPIGRTSSRRSWIGSRPTAGIGWCGASPTARCADETGRDARRVCASESTGIWAPGQRWKGRLQVFKEAGWRQASIVAVWEPGADEPLVTLSVLPVSWNLDDTYDQRFWIEHGFRK